MARIPLVENKQSLAPEHQGIYDAIVKSRGEALETPVILCPQQAAGNIRLN